MAAYCADTGTASDTYVVAPCRGRIVKLWAVLQGTPVGTANNVLTATVGSTTVTIDGWTQLTSGSAAGDIAGTNVTAGSAAAVNEGQDCSVFVEKMKENGLTR